MNAPVDVGFRGEVDDGVCAVFERVKHSLAIANVAAHKTMSPLIHATVARRAFASCMPEAFNVQQYLDTYIDLYLHGITKE